MLDAVRTIVTSDDVRPLNDTVVVEAAVQNRTDIEANVWLLPSAPLADLTPLQDALRKAWTTETGIGFDLVPSWVEARLHMAGVQRVEMLSPSAPRRSARHCNRHRRDKTQLHGARLLMIERIALLPGNATALEKAFSEALDRTRNCRPASSNCAGSSFIRSTVLFRISSRSMACQRSPSSSPTCGTSFAKVSNGSELLERPQRSTRHYAG